MFTPTMDLELSADDQRILRSLLRSTTLGAGLVRRARVILALADGETYAAICAAHGVTDKYIAQWKRRVQNGGVLALGDLPRSGRPDRLDPRVEAKILARTQEAPPAPPDALDHAADGHGDRREPHDGRPRLAAGGVEAASPRALPRER